MGDFVCVCVKSTHTELSFNKLGAIPDLYSLVKAIHRKSFSVQHFLRTTRKPFFLLQLLSIFIIVCNFVHFLFISEINGVNKS